MRTSEIETEDIQLIHMNIRKFSNCCCSLSRLFCTVFGFKKSLHLKLKKSQTLLFGYSCSQVNTNHTKNCKITV